MDSIGAPVYITRSQAEQFAASAGFSGNSQEIMVAIAIAESQLNIHAWNRTDPNGGSYGVVQINGIHFRAGATTQACALDPQCAFNFAWTLSNQGTNWTQWGAYTDGRYKKYLDTPGGPPASNPIVYPKWLADIETYKKTGNTPNRYRGETATPAGHCFHDCEGGVDLDSDPGTPVTAIADGMMMAATASIAPHYGGLVSQRVVIPGKGLNDVYYQHLIVAAGLPLYPWGGGVHMIKAGDILGYTGDIREIEVGFNPGWGGVWGGCGDDTKSCGDHPPGNIGWPDDPRPYIVSVFENSGYNGPGGFGFGGGGIPGSGGSAISNLATITQNKVIIHPDATVAQILAAYDHIMDIENPWPDITTDPLLNTVITLPGILGGETYTFPNYGEYVNDLGKNLSADIAAIFIRLFFIAIGIFIVFRAINQATHLTQTIGRTAQAAAIGAVV